MKNLILFLAFILFLSNTSFSQSIALNRAVKFYETNNIGFAEKEILKALKSPVSSEEELARTMNFFFLIMKKVYGSEEVLGNNLSKLSDLGKAYSKCKEMDKAQVYTPNLNIEMQSLGNTLLNLSDEEFENEEYFKYLLMMDNYVILMNKINVNSGMQFAKMSEASIETHQHKRAMDYLTKMIDSGYKIEKGYEMLIPFFYAHKENDIVDSLLMVADKQMETVNPIIGEVEVRRLIEKGLYFKASKRAKELLYTHSSNIEILYLFGKAKMKMKYYDEGLNALVEVAYLDENHFESRLDLGRYYLQNEDDKINMVLAKNYIDQSSRLKSEDKELHELIEIYNSMTSTSNLPAEDPLVSNK